MRWVRVVRGEDGGAGDGGWAEVEVAGGGGGGGRTAG